MILGFNLIALTPAYEADCNLKPLDITLCNIEIIGWH
jgi:hypothetical protein